MANFIIFLIYKFYLYTRSCVLRSAINRRKFLQCWIIGVNKTLGCASPRFFHPYKYFIKLNSVKLCTNYSEIDIIDGFEDIHNKEKSTKLRILQADCLQIFDDECNKIEFDYTENTKGFTKNNSTEIRLIPKYKTNISYEYKSKFNSFEILCICCAIFNFFSGILFILCLPCSHYILISFWLI